MPTEEGPVFHRRQFNVPSGVQRALTPSDGQRAAASSTRAASCPAEVSGNRSSAASAAYRSESDRFLLSAGLSSGETTPVVGLQISPPIRRASRPCKRLPSAQIYFRTVVFPVNELENADYGRYRFLNLFRQRISQPYCGALAMQGTNHTPQAFRTWMIVANAIG